MVEYNLAKVKVEGSNPFLRKIKELLIELIYFMVIPYFLKYQNVKNNNKLIYIYNKDKFYTEIRVL